MKFPDHFSLEELTFSQTAINYNINNEPTEQEKSNLLRLAYYLEMLRESIRLYYGRPLFITVSSGFRCEELNTRIGGSKTSAHMNGLAADINCPGITPFELASFISEHMEEFDQVILEFNRWIHLGLSNDVYRMEKLTATKENGKVAYKQGIIKGDL